VKLKLIRWWHGLHMEFVVTYQENWEWVRIYRCDHGLWKKTTVVADGEEKILEWGEVD
jgi:hypothetical protein